MSDGGICLETLDIAIARNDSQYLNAMICLSVKDHITTDKARTNSISEMSLQITR